MTYLSSLTLKVGIATIALASGNFCDLSVPWVLPFDFPCPMGVIHWWFEEDDVMCCCFTLHAKYLVNWKLISLKPISFSTDKCLFGGESSVTKGWEFQDVGGCLGHHVVQHWSWDVSWETESVHHTSNLVECWSKEGKNPPFPKRCWHSWQVP